MCRDFNEDKVPSEMIDKLVYAANRAPLAGNIRTAKLVVVTDRTIIGEMKSVSPGFTGDCPLVFVVCTDTSVAQQRSLATFDAGTIAENVSLAAVSLGLGAGFVKSYPEAAVRKILHLPEQVETEIVICLGYPAENQPKAPRSTPIPLFSNQFGNTNMSGKSEVKENRIVDADNSFDLALYMLTSARTTIEEPSRYGPKRLMDSLIRTLKLFQSYEETKKDTFFSSVLAELEERTDMQFSSMVYTKEYKEFLDSLIQRFVAELEKRKM